MRFIYTILLGMIIFNGVLIGFSSFFPTTTSSSIDSVNVTDSSISGYGDIQDISSSLTSILSQAFTIGGIIFAAAAITSFITHNNIYLGIGAFIAVIVAIYGTFAKPIHTILNTYSPTVGIYLFDLFMIIFGIIILLSVVEMLSGQTGVDT